MGTSDGVPYPMEDRMADLEDRQKSFRPWLVMAWVLLGLTCVGTALSVRIAVHANGKVIDLRDSLATVSQREAAWQQGFAAEAESTLAVRRQLADQARAIVSLRADLQRHSQTVTDAAAVRNDLISAELDLITLRGVVERMTQSQDQLMNEQADSLAAFREWMALQRDEMEQKYSQTFVQFNDELTVQQLELGRVKRKLNIMLPLGIVNLVWTGVHTSGDSHHGR